jgi:MFS family permease
VLLATVDNAFGLFAIQLLDGIGGAVVGVIPILMMQDLTQGTGRFSSMQGGVAAALGLGSAVSQLGGGYLAEHFGFSFMFYVMSGIAVLAVVCVVAMDETKKYLFVRCSLLNRNLHCDSGCPSLISLSLSLTITHSI